MRKLIFIKHARPQVAAGVPPEQWGLSEEGRRSCEPLARAVAEHEPAVIVTSREPKARQTAELLSQRLARPMVEAPDLHEHDRSNVPLMATGEFLSMMALFFKERQRLVLGRETAEQAAQRFERAVEQVLHDHPEGNVALVTHGTVLALFAAARGAGDAYQLWRRMELPSLIVFSSPGDKVLQMVPAVA